MFDVLEAKDLAPDVRYLKVRAPKIAQRRKPGQFVIVRASPNGERIPLTIADADPNEGWIALICQGIGKTTRQLNTAVAGDRITDVAGPLGMPSQIEHFGNVVAIGGGVGTAIAYPTAAALNSASMSVRAAWGCSSCSQNACTASRHICCSSVGSKFMLCRSYESPHHHSLSEFAGIASRDSGFNNAEVSPSGSPR